MEVDIICVHPQGTITDKGWLEICSIETRGSFKRVGLNTCKKYGRLYLLNKIFPLKMNEPYAIYFQNKSDVPHILEVIDYYFGMYATSKHSCYINHDLEWILHVPENTCKLYIPA